MIEKKVIPNKKYKITRQYKFLSQEFNPVSLKARYNLNKINLYLKEKEENYKIEQNKELAEKIELDETERENKRKKEKNTIKHELEKAKKSRSFICPSEKEFKKLIQYQQLERIKISQKDGLQNYIQKMIPYSNEVQNLQNLINKKAELEYDFYIIPKIENKKKVIPKKRRNIVSAFHIEKDIFTKNKNKTIVIDRYIAKNRDNKYQTNGFFKRVHKINSTINNNKRIMSAPKIDWREKKQKWKEKNKNIHEEDYKFFLDRPKSPITNDKSVKPLPNGGGVLYSNSIWRIKKINDLIPKLNIDALGKLNDFKRKRKEIIYKKQNSLPYDLTFFSNKQIEE